MPTSLQVQLYYQENRVCVSWAAGSVPQGQTPEFLLTDSAGQTSQNAFDISSGQATLKSSYPVGEGLQYKLQYRLDGQAWVPQTPLVIVIHNVPPPSSVGLTWSGLVSAGRFRVVWTPSLIGFAVEISLLDPRGSALLVQEFRPAAGLPSALDITHKNGTPIGAYVVDGYYTASVVAIEDGSRSAPVTSSACEVDVPSVTVPALASLLSSLRQGIATGNGIVSLTPNVVNQSSITGLFTSLLRSSSSTISVAGANLAHTSTSVTVAGSVDFLWAAHIRSTFLFTAAADQTLILRLTAFPGSMLMDSHAVVGDSAWAAPPVPSGFLRPDRISSPAFVLDSASQTLLLSGVSGEAGTPALYAIMALLLTPAQGTTVPPGFMLAAALNHWTLDSVLGISGAFNGITDILGLQPSQAAVLISNLTATVAAPLTQSVSVLPANMQVSPGLNVSIALDLSGGWLPQVVSMVAPGPNITVFGVVPADDTGTMTLSANLGNLNLLSVLAFQSVVLAYSSAQGPAGGPGTPARTRTLELTGDLTVTLTCGIGNATSQSFTFHGDLKLASSGADFAVTGTTPVANPLGIPGLTLDNVGLQVHVDQGPPQASAITLTGAMSFSTTVLGAVVGFSAGSPTLVVITLDPPAGQPVLTASAFFLKATGLSWPPILDIALSSGQLSWVPGTNSVTWNNTSYPAGFHATVQTSILFFPQMTLAIDIVAEAETPAQKKLTASANLTAPLDWGFIKFTGTQAHGGAAAGPYVSVDTSDTEKPFGLGAGITLFSTAIGDVDIAVAQGGGMTGTVTLASSAGIFAGSNMQFSWTSGQFAVTDWQLADLPLLNVLPDGQTFEFNDLTADGASPCNQVLMDSLPIHSHFNLQPHLSIQPPAAGAPASLNITLSGSFDVEVGSSAYANDPITFTFGPTDPLVIAFPTGGSYDWNALGNSMLDLIKNTAQSMFHSLLSDPKNLAKLAAVAGAQYSIDKVTQYLHDCRGMTDDEIADAIDGITSPVAVPIGPACAGGVALLIGGVVAVISGGQITNQPPASPGQTPPPKPIAPTFSIDTDTAAISWTGSSTLGVTRFGIALSYLSSANSVRAVAVPSVPASATSTTVPMSLLPIFQTYTATIVASGPGGQTASDPTTVLLLPAPVVSAGMIGSQFVAVWSAIQGAGSYLLVVCDTTGQPLSPQSAVSYVSTAPAGGWVVVTATISGPAIVDQAELRIKVSAVAQDAVGAVCQTDIKLIFLAPPPNLLVFSDPAGQQIVASWGSVVQATQYGAELRTQARPGIPSAPIPVSVAIDGLRATFVLDLNSGYASPDTILNFAVKANAAQAESDWTTLPFPAGLLLAFPTLQAISGGDAGIVTTWLFDTRPDPSIAGFELRILSGGVPLNPQPVIAYSQISTVSRPVINKSSLSATIPAGSLVDGQSYTLQLRRVWTGVNGPWSAPSIFTPSAPAGLVARVVSNLVLLSWNAMPNASGYQVALSDISGNPVSPPVSCNGNAAAVDVTGLTNRLTPWGQQISPVYKVQVQGNFAPGTNPTASSVQVTIDTGWSQLGRILPGTVPQIVGEFNGKLWATNPYPQPSQLRSSSDGIYWSQALNVPLPSSVASWVVFAGKFWALGTGQPVQPSVWASADGDNWTHVSPSAQWAPHEVQSAVSFRGMMWVIGWYRNPDPTKPALNEVSSSSDGVTWTSVNSAGPWYPCPVVVAVLDGELYVLSMKGGSPQQDYTGKLWSSADGAVWTEKPDAPWNYPILGTAVVRGVLYVAGTIDRTTPAFKSDLWATRDGVKWVQIDVTGPWSSIGNCSVTEFQNALRLTCSCPGFPGFDSWQYRPPLLVPSGMVPVQLVGAAFRPGAGTIALPISGAFTNIPDLVICCSSVPLTVFSWLTSSGQVAGVHSTWSGYGWKLLEPDTPPEPLNHRYFYMVALSGASIASVQITGHSHTPVSFYASADPNTFPIPDGFAPVMAGSAAELINELFHTSADNPTLGCGSFDPISGSVTAGSNAGGYRIQMTLGSQQQVTTATSKVFACSDVALTAWDWGKDPSVLNSSAGQRSVWTENGWQDVPDGASLPQSAAAAGLYFYSVEMVNLQVLGTGGADIACGGSQAAKVVFYTAG